MKLNAVTIRFIACLTAAWLSAATAWAQPNLADLLDKEDAAQPRPVAIDPGFALPSPTAGPRKEPIPAPAETRQAVAAIQDIFRTEFAAANTPDKRVALAQQLLAQAERTSKSSDRWALFVEAARLAAEAGDPATTFAVIDATTAVYAVDPLTAKLDAIGKLVPKVSPQGADDLTLLCLEMCRTLIGRGALAEARKLLTMTSALTKKSRNRALTAEVNKLTVAIRDAEKVAKERDAILEKLAANPGDPDLCLEAGSYFCFKAGDWEKGLPLLAKGSDAALARLAKDDLAAAGTADRGVVIADAWWDWASKQKGDAVTNVQSRAIVMYETALPTLQGLDRIRVEKRIKEGVTARKPTGQTVFLADMKEASLKGFNENLTKDGTYGGEPFTCGGRRWPKALMTMPRHNDEATIAYNAVGQAKKLVGHVGIFLPSGRPSGQTSTPLTFEVKVDGVIAWRSPAITNCNDMHPFEVPVAGAATIELITKTANAASAWGAWLDPVLTY